MKHTITKAVEFDAAHRLVDYIGPCEKIHGHRYKAVFEFAEEELDSSGFVIDFKIVKNEVKSWIDMHWDHGAIINVKDPLGKILEENGQKVYFFPGNPTAENMAAFLYTLFSRSWKTMLISVTVWETPTSSAKYTPFPV